MKYKDFSPEIWKTLESQLAKESQLAQALDSNTQPIAAFDADGTLWDIDLGESFFQFQIDRKLVPLPADPWAHYLALKALPEGPRKAYLWLAEINQGVPITQVRAWAKECVQALGTVPVFAAQKKWIEMLLSRGVKVYVVTASIQWAVEPGAALLGIPENQVIGVQTQIVDGNVTALQQGVVTYREGKVQGLLEKTQGRFPFFASGNTEGDTELLECSQNLRLAVSAASRDDKLFKTENRLQALAQERNWLHHRFILS